VHGGIVELDALPYADRPAADDQSLIAGQRPGFVLGIVSAVEVRGLRFEFGGAGVDRLVYGKHAPLLSNLTHLLGQAVGEGGDVRVGEAEALGLPQKVRRQRLGEEALLHLDHAVQLVEEPRVDARELR
jgi:hypothetical protein